MSGAPMGPDGRVLSGGLYSGEACRDAAIDAFQFPKETSGSPVRVPRRVLVSAVSLERSRSARRQGLDGCQVRCRGKPAAWRPTIPI